MAMTTRTIAEIRQDLIAAVAVADPETDTSEGSDCWITCNAQAVLDAELQARDLELSRATLPSTATGADLDQHATVWLGTDTRRAATQWFGTVTLTREGASTPVVAIGTVLVHSDGTEYETTEGVAAVDWAASTITVDAQSVDENIGTTGNKAAATPLTVQAPPAGLSASATLASTTTAAIGEEDDETLRARILVITAGQPGSGNAAHYVTWAQTVAGVGNVYTYKRWDGIGHVTVVPLSTTARNRIITAGTLLTAVDTAVQAARPCGCVVTVEAATASAVTVTPTIRVASGYEPGWTGTYTTSAGAHTTTRVYVTADPTTTIEVGDWIVVPIGGNDFSCCRQVVGVTTGASHYIDVESAFETELGVATAPGNAKTVRPGTPNYEAIIDALFDLFDSRGTSSSDDATKPRYPEVATSECPHVYLSDIMAAIDNTVGVVSVDLTAPAANVTNEISPGAAVTLKTLNPAVVVTWGTYP